MAVLTEAAVNALSVAEAVVATATTVRSPATWLAIAPKNARVVVAADSVAAVADMAVAAEVVAAIRSATNARDMGTWRASVLSDSSQPFESLNFLHSFRSLFLKHFDILLVYDRCLF